MRALFLCLLLLLPGMLAAQGAATLVADTVELNGEDQLVASGNVEVLFDGSRLTASQIIFDQPSDTLQITGPIFIRSADGTILTATAATLDPRLENGILQGARIVLDQQLQLAANQIDRRDGRYSQLYKVAATSCRVCGTGPALWDIRAERVVHDTQERQLYFENATFRLRGVPVIWLPRMRLPDPTLERATGFLIPEQRNTNRLGTGIKVPYFVTLGDHRDVTLTPYLSAETTTLEIIYRQAFTNGDLRIDGAISNDTLQPGSRSYIFAEGNFELSNDYQLSFDIEAVSDDAYLVDYDYADKDRLDSAVTLLRVMDTSLYQARFTYYQTLRDDESNASLPPIIADLSYEQRLRPGFGGTLSYGADIDAAHRYSDVDGDRGRDVTRAGANGTWQDSWILPAGFLAEAQFGARADLYVIGDDSAFEQEDLRFIPYGGAVLRWPLGMQGPWDATHLLEPVISVSWAEAFGGTPPNEDSTRTELDAANLFALSRFAGEDAFETGAQLAAGLVWTRSGAAGGSSTLGFGRVVRQEAPSGFTRSSGLDNARSDWLLAGQLTLPDGFLFDARSLWDDTDGLTVADSRLAWSSDRFSLGANYIWQRRDAAENRPNTVSEWSFDSAFELSDAWTLSLDGRYDVAADRPVRGDIGLKWRNECVTIDVSASRRYASSDTVAPTTTFGLSGSISGFSTGRAAGGIGTGCRN
ncbi:LPS-assembly protein LptD [Loktanella sp. Alg231-35]|uniref:LPS-assembly protein LptD n=1 Tax=Loktanella sp. Alg231-35 TaxID=1922220 RepID=UPI000D54D00F|nr:LPS assembly protein LptD [Loktanella sp. Alg231-35]